MFLCTWKKSSCLIVWSHAQIIPCGSWSQLPCYSPLKKNILVCSQNAGHKVSLRVNKLHGLNIVILTQHRICCRNMCLSRAIWMACIFEMQCKSFSVSAFPCAHCNLFPWGCERLEKLTCQCYVHFCIFVQYCQSLKKIFSSDKDQTLAIWCEHTGCPRAKT